jgi:hypothetical protein
MTCGDSRRCEQPICHDANDQENRDHDRRNEVSHGFPCKVNPISGSMFRSQHGVKRRRHEGKAGKHDHSGKKFPLLRGLLSTRRGRLLAGW